MAKSTKTQLTKLAAKEKKEQKLIRLYKKQQTWVKWGLIVAIILLLLWMLAFGYASNWWQGPGKASIKETTPTSSTHKAADKTPASSSRINGGGQSGSSSTGTSDSQRSTNSDSNSSSDTDRSSSTTNRSTTNNSSTTTNNTNNTGSDDSSLVEDLTGFYGGLKVGDTIDSVLARADALDIDYDCNIVLIAVQECNFGVGDVKVTTRNLLGTNLLTSIIPNL